MNALCLGQYVYITAYKLIVCFCYNKLLLVENWVYLVHWIWKVIAGAVAHACCLLWAQEFQASLDNIEILYNK